MSKIGDIVSELCGDWGRWQFRTIVLIFLCKIPSAWFMACIIFTAPYALDGEYSCYMPRVHNLSGDEMQFVYPVFGRDASNQSQYDQCFMYTDYEERVMHHRQGNSNSSRVEYDNIASLYGSRGVQPCEHFVHNSTFNSLVTTFDTVCDKTINLAWTQFWHLFGVLCGGVVATLLLDFVSPRRLMLIGMITQILCGSVTGHVNSLELHSFMRAVSSFCCAQMFTAGQMIFTDITGGNYRKSALCLYEMFWGFGVLLLALIGYALHDWQHIYLAISLPTTFYIVLWAWIPDSPRWLLKHGRIDEARMVLIDAAHMNNRKFMVPINLNDRLKEKAAEMNEAPAPLGWWPLWVGPKAAATMVALHLAWPIYFINYNGMLLNIRAFGREYLYVNTALAGISEVIGVLIAWFFVVETERKWMWTGVFNIVAAFISYLGLLLPDTLSEPVRIYLAMLTAMIPKVATTCAQSVLISSTSELVSARKQRICVFSCVTWARIWFLSAPFVGVFTYINYLVPSIAYAQMGAVGGMAICCIHRWHYVSSTDACDAATKVHNTTIDENSKHNNTVEITRF